ncbi:hypothetical protein [Leucothrix pacifica]|uniref:Uncharacterized protein n=1 Tax=Leucothrix pacifica TaxID=1247513 RepID=A0A317CRZ5_9GAMM|nr:hypothetical protein [Leucothrix pacifica]PWQ99092.1 hypothetical protein DKW60_06545 [Leucothrix pacifica]
MLRSHKKNILFGLLALGLFGLVYGYLNSRPEMIADETLRVAEVPRPELERAVNRPSPFKPDGLGVDQQVNESSMDKLSDTGETVKIGGENLVSAMQDSLAVDGVDGGAESDGVQDMLVAPEAISGQIMSATDSTVTTVDGDEQLSSPNASLKQEQTIIASPKDPYQNPFKSGPRRHTPEPVESDEQVVAMTQEEGAVVTTSTETDEDTFINLTNSEVPLLSEQQSGFLDLNLAEEKPLEVVLLEGDDIIIDDVNETLSKYQAPDEAVLTEVVEESSDEATATSVSKVSMDIVSPFGLAAAQKGFGKQSADLVVLPDPDEVLMNGTDEVSLEYQSSYKKLQSITDKLKAANEENVSLKNQFSKVADDNRKLAQIIRDIDEKIKVLTANN